MCRCACSCSASPSARGNEDADDAPVGNTVVINPEIELLSEERVLRWEGCLSIPGLRAAVPRAPRIRYRGVDCDGQPVAREVSGLPRRRGAARIRPSGRHPVSDAHDRISRCSASTRNWRAPPRRRSRPADDRRRNAAPERDAAIAAMLPHVPFDGWTRRALRMGLADIGALARRCRPAVPRRRGRHDRGVLRLGRSADGGSRRGTGSGDAPAPAGARGDRAAAGAEPPAQGGDPARAGAAGAAAAMRAWRRVCTARTVDAIWHAAGDRSADFSWYTKRAILAAVYAATRAVLAARCQRG